MVEDLKEMSSIAAVAPSCTAIEMELDPVVGSGCFQVDSPVDPPVAQMVAGH